MAKILAIVDDSQMVLNVLKTHFEITFPELTINCFEGGKQILKVLYQDLKVDIIIMDGKLQDGYTGPAYTRSINLVFPDIIIIGFSSDERLKDAFLDSGAKEFVLKTVSTDELNSTLKKYL